MTNDSKTSPARFEDPLRFMPWALSKLYTKWLSLTYPFAALGRDFSAHHTCVMNRVKAPQMKFGSCVTLQKDVWLNVILEVRGEPKIIIDDNCRVGARSLISAKNYIHLERDVIIEESVLIMDHNHGYEDIQRPIREQLAPRGGKIRIGQGCRIGHAAAIICPRAELTLGANCIVLPNSLVTLSAPPYSVLSGNPARVIDTLGPAKDNQVAGAADLVAR